LYVILFIYIYSVMYSLDLKDRAVKMYYAIGSFRKVAKLLNIGKSTLQRWTIDNKTVTENDNIVENSVDNIDSFIKKCMDDNKRITLAKIRSKIIKKFNKQMSLSTIHGIVHKNLGYSYKKINKKYFYGSLDALKVKQTQFINTVNNIDKNKIIAIDETYLHSNFTTDYGWSKVGEPVCEYNHLHSVKYSILMAISNKKIISYKISTTNINTKSFFDFMSDLNGKYTNHYF